ncbi:hypothetical protein BC332_02244 [Capsicum chinense]|nr:hypothetical protein BC332_02244 [Capsicum chinense]
MVLHGSKLAVHLSGSCKAMFRSTPEIGGPLTRTHRHGCPNALMDAQHASLGGMGLNGMTDCLQGYQVKKATFRPYEDVLGIGHSMGRTSILIPGFGEPNFDSWVANPSETSKQRREKEVCSLLEKLPPESIMLDPTKIGKIAKKKQEAVEKAKKPFMEQHMNKRRLTEETHLPKSLERVSFRAYKPRIYWKQLLYKVAVQKSNLEGLLQRHVEMAAEIKNLDTDLQMLVYENYKKFVSATDTIKSLYMNKMIDNLKEPEGCGSIVNLFNDF